LKTHHAAASTCPFLAESAVQTVHIYVGGGDSMQ